MRNNLGISWDILYCFSVEFWSQAGIRQYPSHMLMIRCVSFSIEI